MSPLGPEARDDDAEADPAARNPPCAADASNPCAAADANPATERRRRGALIVFEGCDHSGKTTLAKRIVSELNLRDSAAVEPAKKVPRSDSAANGDGAANGSTAANGDGNTAAGGDAAAAGAAALGMRFPERSTHIGQVINGYLRSERDLDDHVVHLLFSANRWELVGKIKDTLRAGTHVVVDRYAFSGVSFSAAKAGLSLEWCRQPDRGLPRPDLVCFLDVSPEQAAQRGDFGEERYEKEDFQRRVRKNYGALMDERWRVVDTDDKSIDDVYEEVRSHILSAVDARRTDEIEPLWPME